MGSGRSERRTAAGPEPASLPIHNYWQYLPSIMPYMLSAGVAQRYVCTARSKNDSSSSVGTLSLAT